MCGTKEFSRFVAVGLYPLVLISIICSIVLYFPGWDVKYAREGEITDEVTYMGGIIGGGVLVLISPLFIHLTEERCCDSNVRLPLSITFAAVGAVGALYSFIVAFLGLSHGPYCKRYLHWSSPFMNSNMTYLAHPKLWEQCTEPANVVLFNTVLFITLIVISCLQVILCASLVISEAIACHRDRHSKASGSKGPPENFVNL